VRDEIEVVLFAVVGMSPAVLTETLWALAHENPPIVPHRVVVLTTTFARTRIKAMLFHAGATGVNGWDALKNALADKGIDVAGRLIFGDTGDSIRVFTATNGHQELSDIATSEDNDAAADFMLGHLRQFTSRTETAVIASIAGGRKTMSALMISCMSLLGREQDRVCHVLVNPPFDSPLEPPFLFPVKGLKHKDRDAKIYCSTDAKIELTDVPFVRMLGWYEDRYKRTPPKYSALVSAVQRQVPKVYPSIVLTMKTGRVAIAGETLELSPAEFMVLHQRCLGNTDLQVIGENLWRYKRSKLTAHSDFYCNFIESSRFSVEGSLKEDLSRCDSSLRRKLKSTPLSPYVDDLIPKRGRPQSYPKGKITIKGYFPFAEESNG